MEDDEYFEHKDNAVSEWLEQVKEPELTGNLDEACYTISELGILGDYGLTAEMALMSWRIVEKLRSNEFPEEFKM